MKDTPQPIHVDSSCPAIAVDCAGAVAWTAGMLRKGLSRVYAVQLADCFESKHHVRLVERWRQDSADSAMTGELEAALAAWGQAEPAERAALVERLGPIIFAAVDRVLEQAQAAGRDRTGVHLAAARFGLEVVILADPDPHQAWLVPTTQTRLREVLAELDFYPTAAETQQLDVAQGDTLQLLGYEFRVVKERGGRARVQYKPIEAAGGWEDEGEAARSGLLVEGILRWLAQRWGRDKPSAARTPAPPPARKAPVHSAPGEEPGTSDGAGLPGPAATTPGVAAETAAERRSPLLVRLRDWLPAWLDYAVPLPSWRSVAALGTGLLREWRWLAPLLAVQAGLAWLYFHGSTLDGSVRYQGQPVAHGRVVLAPAETPDAPPTVPLTARIENGRYRLSGLEPSAYRVTVILPAVRTKKEVTVEVGYLGTSFDLDVDAMTPWVIKK